MVILTNEQRKAIFANMRDKRVPIPKEIEPKILDREKLKFLVKKYGERIGNDPDVITSDSVDEAARRAKIIEIYGFDAVRNPGVLTSSNYKEAQIKARQAIKKEAMNRGQKFSFMSPKRAEKLREGGEFGGQQEVTKQFEKLFTERLRQQVELEKKKREMIESG